MKAQKVYTLSKTYKLINKNNIYKKEDNITLKEFLLVIKLFNKKIIREIIEGYIFKSMIGTFKVVTYESKKLKINWKESNLAKQALIDKGITPYNRRTAPEGKKYHIYYIDNRMYGFNWKKPSGCGYWRFLVSKLNNFKLGRFLSDIKNSDRGNELEGKYEFL